ncbi:hypothetical protein [Streptomyces spirodelae]|uniref:Uncharacterized protein n=1 Tax=Streptomyces spirodelae TaxID=2812904 RepID=A0ABS3X1G2_9ACTN|nr:hypothetical protein [Streptomyces spirodelae]MBO8189218.1 hypothetical protein [Streptomyces spirodelae]
MIELLVLAAIAYAGARGVESLAGTADRRHASKDAEKTVAKVAASGPSGGSRTAKKPPGPTEPGGTFSAASPRSAQLGGKAAVPLAVITETGATMWKATLEGYRERWPEIREERRKAMADRAAKRKADKEAAAAKKKAEAAAKAGPPPPYPPPPTEPPKTTGTETDKDDSADAGTTAAGGDKDGKEPKDGEDTAASAPPSPSSPDEKRAEAAEARASEAERKTEAARRAAEEEVRRAATEKVLAAQKAEREAKERAAAAEKRAAEAEKKAADTLPDAGRRHLSVVPSPAQNGDPMSSPSTVIPEIRTLDGLMNALTLTQAMCAMRAEEAEAIAADDLSLSNRLDQIESESGDLEVDDGTRGEIDALRESIHAQSQSAAQYGTVAKDAGDFAVAVAAAAYKSHGGIAEAVQSSPIDSAAQAGYYNQ